MSVYQNSYQASYTGPQYSRPGTSYPQYQQHPPPHLPYYHVDPHSFRREFSARLAELTINSRPLIQNLSRLAQEYMQWADAVGQCLEPHIRKVPVWMKLPAFYLLDAIAKNVYEPYARLFSGFVINLFLETYQQVDQATRSKMEEMLLTWRTAAPSGRELFGIATQRSIERGIWGGGDDNGSSTTTNGHGSHPVSKAQVLSELEFILSQKERALQTSPWDTMCQKHVEILLQLRRLVDTGPGVSQNELQQILNQLRSLSRTSSSVVPPQVAHPPQQLPSYPPPPATYQYPPVYPPATQGSSNHSPESASSAYGYPSQPHPAPPSIPTTSGPSPQTTDIANLFNAIVKAGVLPGASVSSNKSEAKPRSAEVASESILAYRTAILSQSIQLTNADITRKRPDIVHLLYDRLPVQCKQCGTRFTSDTNGKKDMEDHMDMHFKQNRKASQNVGRGHSRSWFVNLDDWLDEKGKGRGRPANAKAFAVAEAAEHDANLRSQYVVVPSGEEAMPISCPICKESLKSEFLEDDEEWVWKNAVKRDDRIYHATCHAEAASTMQTLASRLRTETTGRSRSTTPDIKMGSSTPPKAILGLRTSLSPSPDSKRLALKRKADNTPPPSAHPSDEQGTPPNKKVALAA
ncbi:hypothetical protein CONPUDRAFT_136662 [Coniophora puteana RWD-64-598 SS2]|uniref:CID domain-containing protein n=1 Tax=Coniophora puteana (strain RWD-64-598) TaxID=741705 RepID=A0A5M3MSG0_CONPW|nr:uncharacterized protein CONPUDRAFT_136662 [Coniophora puteana RWD-64-598 SS2]EIW82099.1 hypothetical protein CONPUDRAFT_136662 [Coniophora puteana RWD-64-598 SS2]